MTLLASLLLLAGAAASPDALLEGAWDNSAQVTAAPAAARVAPSVGGVWLDRQHARFAVVDAPLVGGRVVYLEWRAGGPEGPVSRQRIWRFRETAEGPRMDFFTIAAPERFAGRGGEAGAFVALRPDELTGYGAACAMRWTRAGDGWRGRIAPADCRIVARSGRGMRLDVTVALTARAMSYHERGVLDDGGVAFDVPSFAPYAFDRVR